MEKASDKPKIVKNKSSAYGYKYSNLADLAEAGVNIPKMRVLPTEYGEYIEYFDDGEWHMGAKIVELEMKGMNAAQAYGSALTYARRYTVMMAEGIACDDDDALERKTPESSRAKGQPSKDFKKMDFAKIKEQTKQITELDDLTKLYKSFTNLTAGQQNVLQRIFSERRSEIGGANE